MKLVEQSLLFYLLSKIIFIVKTIIISFLMFIIDLNFFFKKDRLNQFLYLIAKIGFCENFSPIIFFSRYDLGH